VSLNVVCLLLQDADDARHADLHVPFYGVYVIPLVFLIGIFLCCIFVFLFAKKICNKDGKAKASLK
jgi:hypothetical protein